MLALVAPNLVNRDADQFLISYRNQLVLVNNNVLIASKLVASRSRYLTEGICSP